MALLSNFLTNHIELGFVAIEKKKCTYSIKRLNHKENVEIKG